MLIVYLINELEAVMSLHVDEKFKHSVIQVEERKKISSVLFVRNR